MSQRDEHLKLWEQKVVNRLKRGQPALCRFESDTIHPLHQEDLGVALEDVTTAEGARALFARARHWEPVIPKPPLSRASAPVPRPAPPPPPSPAFLTRAAEYRREAEPRLDQCRHTIGEIVLSPTREYYREQLLRRANALSRDLADLGGEIQRLETAGAGVADERELARRENLLRDRIWSLEREAIHAYVNPYDPSRQGVAMERSFLINDPADQARAAVEAEVKRAENQGKQATSQEERQAAAEALIAAQWRARESGLGA